jgi:DNA-binding MarR family transcriptional regulator
MAQCHALVEIGRAKGISLVELSGMIGLDTSTMSRTVNNLVTKKMAKRELDPNDRRYVTIQLTPAGDTHFREIESSMESYFGKIYEAIPETDRAQVNKSLAILLKAIDDSDCC